MGEWLISVRIRMMDNPEDNYKDTDQNVSRTKSTTFFTFAKGGMESNHVQGSKSKLWNHAFGKSARNLRFVVLLTFFPPKLPRKERSGLPTASRRAEGGQKVHFKPLCPFAVHTHPARWKLRGGERMALIRCKHLLSRWRVKRERRNSLSPAFYMGTGERRLLLKKKKSVPFLAKRSYSRTETVAPHRLLLGILVLFLWRLFRKPVTSQFGLTTVRRLVGKRSGKKALYYSTFARAFRCRRWKTTKKSGGKKKKSREVQ